jgi:hypothetical protein
VVPATRHYFPRYNVSGMWIRTADSRNIAGCKTKWEEGEKRQICDEAGYSRGASEMIAMGMAWNCHSRHLLPARYVMAVREPTEPLAPYLRVPSTWFVPVIFFSRKYQPYTQRSTAIFLVHLHHLHRMSVSRIVSKPEIQLAASCLIYVR